jgi:hypothetical protein
MGSFKFVLHCLNLCITHSVGRWLVACAAQESCWNGDPWAEGTTVDYRMGNNKPGGADMRASTIVYAKAGLVLRSYAQGGADV